MPDSYHLRAEALFQGIHEELGSEAIIVGGGAAEDGSVGKTLQFLDGQIQTDAVSGVVFGGRAEAIHRNIPGLSADGASPNSSRGRRRTWSGKFPGSARSTPSPKPAGPEWMENIQHAAMNLFHRHSGRSGQGSSSITANTSCGPSWARDEERGNHRAADAGENRPGHHLRQAGRASRERGTSARCWKKGRGASPLPREKTRARSACISIARGRGSSLYGETDVDAGAIREKMGGLPVAGFLHGFPRLRPSEKIDHLHQYSGVLVLLGEDAD